MSTPMLINGEVMEKISPLDRGFAYGDGVFETLRVVRGVAPLWLRHIQRLTEGCARLHLSLPDADVLAREVHQVGRELTNAVVRITLTRGCGARGYAFSSATNSTRIVAAFPSTPLPRDSYTHGIRARWCTTRLAIQPALAGIKHLNRLEQVLARAEWNDTEIFEGIMCDTEERVISSTAANIFCVHNGHLMTPALSRCGVAGVARATLLDNFDSIKICDLMPEELMQASEIFLSSSVRGILPVRMLADTTWVPGPITRELQAQWQMNGWMANFGEQS